MEPYKFIKVEDYFYECEKGWEVLDTVLEHEVRDEGKTLALKLRGTAGGGCVVLLQIPAANVFRVRCNPSKTAALQYTDSNTRTIVGDNFSGLKSLVEPFSVAIDAKAPLGFDVSLTTSMRGEPVLRLAVAFKPFTLVAFRLDREGPCEIFRSASLRFAPNGNDDYAVAQSVNKPAAAKYVGFGEHGGTQMCKNGKQLTFFNYDNMGYNQVYNQGPFEDREPLYHSDPFFMEYNAVPGKRLVNAMFVDNPSQVCMDIGHSNSSKNMFGTRYGDLDYYMFSGKNSKDLFSIFMTFVGTARLKPRYALGFHQGCYGYEQREDLEKVVDIYRRYRIPLDGLHIDVDFQDGYRTFTVDEQKFPNPAEMFQGLREKGVKCSTNITPIINNQEPHYSSYQQAIENDYFVVDTRVDMDSQDSCKTYWYENGEERHGEDCAEAANSGQPFIGGVNYGGDRAFTGSYPDLGRKDVRVWWGAQYRHLFELGLEMVWQDMTTPCLPNERGDMKTFPFRLLVTNSHHAADVQKPTPAVRVVNLYSYNLHKATYHGLNYLDCRHNKRNFIVGRGCFTGMHRFAALWTGDNRSTWDFYRINISQILALGMTGQAMSGEDIGGFEAKDGEQWCDPELLIRWTVAGAFLPWFRNHYIKKDAKKFQEVYAYGPEFFDSYARQYGITGEARKMYDMVVPVCRHYIELRYRLLQLFYDAMFENSLNGMPICRPLFLTDDLDETLFNDQLEYLDNQFLIRNDLLVAPVLEKESECRGERTVYLPCGSDWYQFMDNRYPLIAPITGGSTIYYDAHIGSAEDHVGFVMPLFVRAGAIIPVIGTEQYVGELDVNPITYTVYPGEKGEYVAYLDDGVSRSSAPGKDSKAVIDGHEVFAYDPMAQGEYRSVQITTAYSANGLRHIRIRRVHDNYQPKELYFYVAVLHAPQECAGENQRPASVSLDGKALAFLRDQQELDYAGTDAGFYDPRTRITWCKVFDTRADMTLELSYA